LSGGRAILATPVLAGLLRVVAAGNLGLLFGTRASAFSRSAATLARAAMKHPGDYQVDGDSGLRA